MIKLLAKPVIEIRRAKLLEQTHVLRARAGRAPHLAVVLVGNDPASEVYVGKKGEAAEAVGFTHETLVFEQSTSPERVRQKVQELNDNPNVDGILIQRPLPPQFSEK